MITCMRCASLNDTASHTCSQCGADLLPGEGAVSRIVYIGLGIFVAAVLIATAVLLLGFAGTNPNTRWAAPALIAAGVAFMALAVYASLYKTPLWQRYAARGKRHLDIEVGQALADFTEALKLVPAKERLAVLEAHQAAAEKAGDTTASRNDLVELKTIYGEISGRLDARERSNLALKQINLFEKLEQVHHKLGDNNLALNTHLEYLTWVEEHIEDIISTKRSEGLASFVTGSGDREQMLVRDFQPRYLLVNQVKDDRAHLMQTGAIAAVGYCIECRQVYRLKSSLVCPANPRHGRLSLVEYILPGEIDRAEQSLRQRVARKEEALSKVEVA